MAKLRILKAGKYCLHPSNGPIFDFKKGFIDSDSIEGCDPDAIQSLIDDKWVEIVEEKQELEDSQISPSVVYGEMPKRKRGRPPLNG